MWRRDINRLTDLDLLFVSRRDGLLSSIDLNREEDSVQEDRYLDSFNMTLTIIQGNLNRSWRAYDMLNQFISENRVDLGLISEPPAIPTRSSWFGSTDRGAAIVRPPECSPPLVPLRKGEGFAAGTCGDIVVVAFYCSPNIRINKFAVVLDGLSEILADVKAGRIPGRVIIGGDFNAKSALWDSPITDRRGEILQEWAAQWNLCLVNDGKEPTCIHPQGSSYIDVTWASVSLMGRVIGWKVLTNFESLSDHPYILFEIRKRSTHRAPVRGGFPRWSTYDMDSDLFCETLDWLCSALPKTGSASAQAIEITRVVSRASDLSARRITSRPSRRPAYWWNESIALARRLCIRRRRIWLRARTLASPTCERERLRYRAARNKLRSEIRRAKASAWNDLINEIERDPWGLPYKLVMGRLRPLAAGLTVTLRPEILERLLQSLFPDGITHDPKGLWRGFTWEEINDITHTEVAATIKRARPNGGDPAPGPDGIRLSIWKKAPCALIKRLTRAFNACLREGTFPTYWKRALVVLIPKNGSLPTWPLARPICLINESGKILERVLVDRLRSWMAENPVSGLADQQYGFREGRSTYNALSLVTGAIREATDEGDFMMAVSIDIRNAFNSVSWTAIRAALQRKQFLNTCEESSMITYTIDRLNMYPRMGQSNLG